MPPFLLSNSLPEMVQPVVYGPTAISEFKPDGLKKSERHQDTLNSVPILINGACAQHSWTF